jgi:hypothetical protein
MILLESNHVLFFGYHFPLRGLFNQHTLTRAWKLTAARLDDHSATLPTNASSQAADNLYSLPSHKRIARQSMQEVHTAPALVSLEHFNSGFE